MHITITENVNYLTGKAKLELWEERLIKKINSLDYFSIANVVLTFVILNIIGFEQINGYLIVSALLGVLVLFFNKRGKYLLGLYTFFSIGVFLLGAATYYMNLKSNVFMYFFPVSLSIVLLCGRRELFKHMVIWLTIYFSVVTSLLILSFNGKLVELEESTNGVLAAFNAIFSFLLSLVLVVIVTRNHNSQERELQKSLDEKQLLLAELFHRVKNNLNVVTSILSLKKNASQSEDVRNALDECRNRVFSMALIHQQVYAGNEMGSLNMRTYLIELVRNIQQMFGNEAKLTMDLSQDHLDMTISKAIPVGLIVNELLSNIYKHSKHPDRELEYTIRIHTSPNLYCFDILDNGVGFDLSTAQKSNSLGLEIVESLVEQIDGNLTQIPKEEGCHLRLCVPR
jgi:two-component sensor histidine kinase